MHIQLPTWISPPLLLLLLLLFGQHGVRDKRVLCEPLVRQQCFGRRSLRLVPSQQRLNEVDAGRRHLLPSEAWSTEQGSAGRAYRHNWLNEQTAKSNHHFIHSPLKSSCLCRHVSLGTKGWFPEMQRYSTVPTAHMSAD